MDSRIDAISSALEGLLGAINIVLQAGEDTEPSGGSAKKAARMAALESFQNQLQLFHAACDHAQEHADNARHRVMSQILYDEARGPPPAMGQAGLGTLDPALSVARMEQLSRFMETVIEDLHHPNPPPSSQNVALMEGTPGGPVLTQELPNAEIQEVK